MLHHHAAVTDGRLLSVVAVSAVLYVCRMGDGPLVLKVACRLSLFESCDTEVKQVPPHQPGNEHGDATLRTADGPGLRELRRITSDTYVLSAS